jgi:hypothetical protein
LSPVDRFFNGIAIKFGPAIAGVIVAALIMKGMIR